MVEAAAFEFAETAKFLDAGEGRGRGGHRCRLAAVWAAGAAARPSCCHASPLHTLTRPPSLIHVHSCGCCCPSSCAGEAIAGEYVWGRYDLLLLPPSFPYGWVEWGTGGGGGLRRP